MTRKTLCRIGILTVILLLLTGVSALADSRTVEKGDIFQQSRHDNWKFYPEIVDVWWTIDDRSIVDFRDKPNMGTYHVGDGFLYFKAVSVGETVITCHVTSQEYQGMINNEQIFLQNTSHYTINVTVTSGSNVTPSDPVNPTPTPKPTSGECNGLKWNVSDDGTFTITGNGAMPGYGSNGAVWDKSKIKRAVIGEGVTSIGNNAFNDANNLTSVQIADSVTQINTNAFVRCSSLTSITIPKNVTHIGSNTFYGCTSLKNVYAASLESWLGINFDDFDSNPLYYAENLYINGKLLTELVIPEGITSIKWSAFYSYDKLTSVTIPKSVTEIGGLAFGGCENLKNVYAASLESWLGITFGSYSSNPLYYAENLYVNGKLLTELVIPQGIASVNAYAFYGYDKLTSVTIPKSVTKMDEQAFNYCGNLKDVYAASLESWLGITFNTNDSNPLYYAENLYVNGKLLTELVIPQGIASVNAYAFYGYEKLTGVSIPDSVTDIGEDAFKGLTNCTSIRIPQYVVSGKFSDVFGKEIAADVTLGNGVTSIDDEAFVDCANLKSIKISEKVTSIGAKAFKGCKGLSSIVLPESVQSIGTGAFTDCESLASVDMYQASITALPAGLFKKLAKLNDVDLPWVLETIPEELFRGSGVTNVVISKSVKTIERYAFADCKKLESLSLKKVAVIGEGAFSSSGLTSLSIPDSVTTLSSKVLYGCSALTSLLLSDNLITIETSALEGCSMLDMLFLPDTLTTIGGKAFKGTAIWDLSIPDSVTSIGKDAFDECNKLGSISMGASLTSLPAELFYGLPALSSVTLPENLTAIPDRLFMNCPSLVWISIPDSVTHIGTSAFESSTVSTLSPGEGLQSIGNNAFKNCANLKGSIFFPDSLATIGESAFEGCKKLEAVCADYLLKIGKKAFNDCSSLKYFPYSAKLEEIGESAFEDCDLSWGVTLPGSLKIFGKRAFCSCDGLTSVECEKGLSMISEYAFYSCSSLTDLQLTGTIKLIDTSAFEYCGSLKKLQLPEGLTKIGAYAFRDTGISGDIVLPTTMTSFGGEAFYSYYYSSIKHVYIDIYYDYEKERSINWMFKNEVEIHWRNKGILSNGFYWEQNGALVTISGTGEFTKTDIPWNYKYLYTIKFTSGVTSIADYAIPSSHEATQAYFPSTLTKIGTGNFPDLRIVRCEDANEFNWVRIGKYNCGTGVSDSYSNSRKYTVYEVSSSEFTPISFISLPSDFEIQLGESKTLDVSTSPNASLSQIQWTSSAPDVVSVKNGVVTALGVGKATITAKWNNATDSMTVTVYCELTDYRLSMEEAWIECGAGVQIEIVDKVHEQAAAEFAWKSSDKAVAEADGDGWVTTYKAGETTITVTSDNGISRECTIYVYEPITAVECTREKVTIPLNSTLTLTVNVTSGAETLVNKLVSFVSSDASVVSVDNNGKLTAHKPGTVTITAEALNGVSVKCEVTVSESEDCTHYDVVIDEEIDATCTVPGKTEGIQCAICNAVIKEQTEIPAPGHTEETVPGKAATCTETGFTDGVKCSVCGETITAQTEIPALGHTEETVPGKAATCVDTGLTDGVKCSVCGEILSAQEEIPATGHDEGEWIVVTEATAETEGLKELRCTVCGYVLETKVIPVVGARIPGDVNSDGVIDGRDLLRLARYIGGFDVEISMENASVNGDDIVDGRDLLRLARYVGGYDVTLE